MPYRGVAFILIIQIRAGLTVILVWITPYPRQNIGGGFPLSSRPEQFAAMQNFVHKLSMP
jgi:hypothetical protein